MKNTSIIAIICFILINNTKACDTTYYKVFVTQNKTSFEVTPGKKHTVKLKPGPFKLKFEMVGMNSINISPNHDTIVYSTPLNSAFSNCENIGMSMGAEYYKNKEKDMIVYPSNEGYLSWYYDSDSDHRYDPDIQFRGDTMLATRTIEKYWYVPGYKSGAVENDKRDLYLVFFVWGKEPCGETSQIVPDRRFVRIKFKN